MASELNLPALRECIDGYLERSGGPTGTSIRVPWLIFILRQIERVAGCEWCDEHGKVCVTDEPPHEYVDCGDCERLRADLLALQREVLGVSDGK